jgi:molecular chaperone GrpE
MTEDNKDIQNSNGEAGPVRDGKEASAERINGKSEKAEGQSSNAKGEAGKADADKTETGKSESGKSESDFVSMGQIERIARLETENTELRDKLLRAMAEVENVRRRTEREKVDIAKYAINKFAGDVVGVADNIRRAIDATPKDAASSDPALKCLAEGIEVTERELMNVLERHGIKRIDPLHEKFDPNFHQAMFEEESMDVAPGAVVRVMQAGFMIEERLLRPALVSVAKAWTGPVLEVKPAVVVETAPPPKPEPVVEQAPAIEFEAIASNNASIRESRAQGFGPAGHSNRPEWTAPRPVRPNPRGAVTELRKPAEGQNRPRVSVEPNPFTVTQRPQPPQVKAAGPASTATVRPSTLHQPVIPTQRPSEPQKKGGGQ